jgi:collagenase-like PrtC family protease
MKTVIEQAEPVEIGPGRIFTKAEPVPPPVATFTVSARGKPRDLPVFAYLRENYGNLRMNEVDSLFGFVEKCTLYGGRQFADREFSDNDVKQLNSAGIGIRIPMSNHVADRKEYRLSSWLLRKYHVAGNSIICTNDDLARWIREDFPDYRLDASVIKNIKSHKKIEAAMELYDSVVLPMPVNEDLAFLAEIENKDKITLFANAGCALTCPSRICYPSISRLNKRRGGEFQCSQPIKNRDQLGMVDFPLEPYIELGFHRFKLLRARSTSMTGH